MYNKCLLKVQITLSYPLINILEIALFQKIKNIKQSKERFHSYFPLGQIPLIFFCSLWIILFCWGPIGDAFFSVLLILRPVITITCTYLLIPSVVFSDYKIVLRQTGVSCTCFSSVCFTKGQIHFTYLIFSSLHPRRAQHTGVCPWPEWTVASDSGTKHLCSLRAFLPRLLWFCFFAMRHHSLVFSFVHLSCRENCFLWELCSLWLQSPHWWPAHGLRLLPASWSPASPVPMPTGSGEAGRALLYCVDWHFK